MSPASRESFWTWASNEPRPVPARRRRPHERRTGDRGAAAHDARGGLSHVRGREGRRARDRERPPAPGRGAARRSVGAGAQPDPDRPAARPRGRPRDDRGLALRSRARRAGHQAGARRSDRGDLPGARVPDDAAAVRRDPADRHGRHGDPPAHLGDVQGRSGRPDSRPDVRLHAPASRLRSGRRAASGDTPPREADSAAADPAPAATWPPSADGCRASSTFSTATASSSPRSPTRTVAPSAI